MKSRRLNLLVSLVLAFCIVLGIVPSTVSAANPENQFEDVKETDWYYDGVKYVYENELMYGTGKTTFSPNDETTRGMIITILWRLEGSPEATGTSFDDVDSNAYYAQAVLWATENGIISGYGNNQFGPDDSITREQMATILYRYAGYKGYDITAATNLSNFEDNDSISSYATQAMAWAYTKGLIVGTSGTTLSPQGYATRAQVAVIMMRFSKYIPVIVTYNVVFNLNYDGAGVYQTIEVENGATITKPQNPSRRGYNFNGWYTKASGGTKFEFDTAIKEDITLYARWAAESSGKTPSTKPTPDPNEDEDNNYTRGEWIQILCEKLDINLKADPADIDYYFADTQNNQYGVAIETAQAYGILPVPDIEDLEQDIPYFYPDEIATREFAAYTAVRAMGFDGSHSEDTSHWIDWDEITYQNEAAIAVAFEFLLLENNYFKSDDPLKSADIRSIKAAIDALNESIIVTPENAHDDSELAPGVLKDELSDITEYTITEATPGNYTVTLPRNNATAAITTGDVIILSPNDIYVTGAVFKVVEADTSEDNVILDCIIPGIEEVFAYINFAGKGTAIVSGIVPAENVSCEYDPNGSVDEDEVEETRTQRLNIDIGGSTKVPGTLKFKVAEKEFSENLKASGTVEIEIPDVTCILDAHFGLFNTNINEFTISIQEKIKLKGELALTLAESGYELTNSLGNTRWEKGRIELGRLPIAITAGLSFDIVFFYNVEAKGTASITYTIVSTQGYQYKKGIGRSLFDFDDSLDFLELKGSAKAGVGISGVLCAFNLMDLVGYAVEFGLGINASFTPHVVATETLYCGDATLYAYAESGLDKETAIGLFLDKVCHYTLEFEHLKNDEKNPLKLKFHVENGLIVEECTFGLGGISGYVATLDENTPIANARIKIYSGGSLGDNLVRTLYTNSQGKYSLDNLHDGEYRVLVSATGYFTYDVIVKVEKYSTTYVETLLMVDRDGSGEASLVEGRIVDALTGNGLSDTSYVLRSGWNNFRGNSIASGEFTSDSYSLSLAIGNYTLQVGKSGYITNYINIAVSANTCTNANVSLSPENTGIEGDTIRIVLTWGEHPYDLDSHLFGTASDNSSQLFHTYYGDKDYYYNSELIANLDLDDVTSYGPETTTIYSINPEGLYSFYVHDYTNKDSETSIEMSLSGAIVKIYIDNVIRYTFNVPVNTNGTVWHVFDYNALTNTIIPVNTFAYGPVEAQDNYPQESDMFTSAVDYPKAVITEAEAVEIIESSEKE